MAAGGSSPGVKESMKYRYEQFYPSLHLKLLPYTGPVCVCVCVVCVHFKSGTPLGCIHTRSLRATGGLGLPLGAGGAVGAGALRSLWQPAGGGRGDGADPEHFEMQGAAQRWFSYRPPLHLLLRASSSAPPSSSPVPPPSSQCSHRRRRRRCRLIGANRSPFFRVDFFLLGVGVR